MPLQTLQTLRKLLPNAKPYLMYGLTEAFRSTYLPPEEIDRRPDSIGKAIPNAEILVLREDGSECAPNEPGELVHRGALVNLDSIESYGGEDGVLVLRLKDGTRVEASERQRSSARSQAAPFGAAGRPSR